MGLVVTCELWHTRPQGNSPNGHGLHGLDGPGSNLQLEELALTRNAANARKCTTMTLNESHRRLRDHRNGYASRQGLVGAASMIDDQQEKLMANGCFKQSSSGLDPFRTGSQNLAGSRPRTELMDRCFLSPEPWTGPWTSSAGFRFEPWF